MTIEEGIKMALDARDNEITRLTKENERLKRNLQARLADHINGTPCAEIRWQQERETLTAEVARLTAEVAQWQEVARASEKRVAYQGSENERLTARVKELEAALERIANLPGELNPSNYDHDDVCACNAALCETWGIARAALTQPTKGGE